MTSSRHTINFYSQTHSTRTKQKAEDSVLRISLLDLHALLSCLLIARIS